MPRTVRVSELFWSERDFKKAFRELPAAEQDERLDELEALRVSIPLPVPRDRELD